MIKKVFAILFLIIIVALVVYLIYNHEKAARVDTKDLYPAKYWQKLSGGLVQCNLCPNRCILSEGQIGICRAKQNVKGELYSITYGKISSEHIDPVEKKPFFHVLPGAKAFSIASTGCNLRCKYCQNWQISQVFPWEVKTKEMTPEEVVEAAIRSNSEIIAFTYNEPIVNYEFMLDTAKLAKQKGLKTVVVSAGYINPEPLRELLKYIDAYKVDFKGFNEKFYQDFVGGHLQPVLETMKIIKEEGVWLEIVVLLIPGENDSEEEIRAMTKWIKENLGDEVPVHFSRFYPMYKLKNLPPTPIETVIRAWEIAKEEGLKYVYTGNISYPKGEATYCPESGEVAIQRQGYFIISNNLKNGQCPTGEKIPGIWK